MADEKKDRPIDLGLVQDTLDYLVKCPYGTVKDLISRWEEAFKPEETKQE
jgi:hypothetical protein